MLLLFAIVGSKGGQPLGRKTYLNNLTFHNPSFYNVLPFFPGIMYNLSIDVMCWVEFMFDKQPHEFGHTMNFFLLAKR